MRKFSYLLPEISSEDTWVIINSALYENYILMHYFPAKCHSPVQQNPASYTFSFFRMDDKKDFQNDFPGDCVLLLAVHDFS